MWGTRDTCECVGGRKDEGHRGVWLDTCECVGGRKNVGDTWGVWLDMRVCGWTE